jgi:hypothetical protein
VRWSCGIGSLFKVWMTEVASCPKPWSTIQTKTECIHSHYTQNIWRTTTEIGCWTHYWDVTGGYKVKIICHYKRPGNDKGYAPAAWY